MTVALSPGHAQLWPRGTSCMYARTALKCHSMSCEPHALAADKTEVCTLYVV